MNSIDANRDAYEPFAAKRRRDQLFARSRPFVRRLDWANDFWVLWAAYDLDSFPKMPKGLTREQFAQMLQKILSTHSSILLVEDDNKHFRNGRGPCALVAVDNFGWRIEPHVEFFRWASDRIKLRSYVAFFQLAKNSEDFGVCVVRCPKQYSTFIRRLSRYCLLHPCGMVPKGSRYGDEYLYSIESRLARHGARKLEAPVDERRVAA